MKTRTNLSAVLSLAAVTVLAGSALADQPVKVATVAPQAPVVKPYNPDFNHDGKINVQDIFDYLTAWLAGKIECDVNGNGILDGFDILDYINAWFGNPTSK